ncbi:hypothetical protein DC498_16720 [Terrimonas sp.]|uniref:hypothetical protein n=1 Tax=Terrimonas sp. TaxID=1914338 RepID=UPI000D51CCAB|nr:hypothetical protein [Terrimonas sp.]PVD51060.1 hypothetical protein DC498_16720 [Terrimonas sp.]
MEKELIQSLQQVLSLQLADTLTKEKLKHIIAERVNDLIQHDFAQLTQLLYRIDINEARLKKLLNEAGEKDAAGIIAELIIERQVEKLESREQFKQDNDISEEDKW